MCYAAPGPRCSGHAAEYIEQAQIVLHDAVEERQRYQAKFSLGECSSDEYEERNIALREARAALDDHVLQFQETPAYWKAAEQKAGRTKIPRMRYELENSIADGKQRRVEKMKAYHASRPAKRIYDEVDATSGQMESIDYYVHSAPASNANYLGATLDEDGIAQAEMDRRRALSDSWRSVERVAYRRRVKAKEKRDQQVDIDMVTNLTAGKFESDQDSADYATEIVNSLNEQRKTGSPDADSVNATAVNLASIISIGRHKDSGVFETTEEIIARNAGIRVKLSRGFGGLGSIKSETVPVE